MKIGILHFQHIENPLCGDHTYLLNLSRSLDEKGHRVSILSLFDTPSEISLWGDRLRRTVYSAFISTKVSEFSHYDIALFTEPLYPHNMMLLRYLKFMTKVPIVLYLRVPQVNSTLYYLPIRGMFPALISGEIARPFAERIASKVELVNPGIDTTKLYPVNMDKKCDLLYVGHLYREKGVLLLLQAMQWLRSNGAPLRLKIVHTPCKEEKFYRRYIVDNRLDNVDMERIIIADNLAVYNSARVFVYPGVAYHRVHATPLAILEASACGLPVVCTSLYRHIGLPNITFADPDAKSLAGALLEAVSKSNVKKCEQAIEIIRAEYSLSIMGRTAESFFAQIIDGHRNHGRPAIKYPS